MPHSDIKNLVKEKYAEAAREIATSGSGGCCERKSEAFRDCAPITGNLYAADQLDAVPDAAAAASLGCGNPTALAALAPGETVLDLGSGGGIDVLLSARRVGPTGKAYGLDMTPEMLELARRNQADAGVPNAEFLAGTIESVPLPDASVDVIISNCVINLAADKDAVLREAFRVLKPGGRFAVSDIVLLKPLPEPAQRAMRLWTGCVAGALVDTDYVARLGAAGFTDASVEITRRYDRGDLDGLAADLRPEEIPADLDLGEVLAEMDRAKANGSWAFLRVGAPVPAQAGTLTRQEVLADLARAQKHPTWSARRVGAPVSMD